MSWFKKKIERDEVSVQSIDDSDNPFARAVFEEDFVKVPVKENPAALEALRAFVVDGNTSVKKVSQLSR